MNDLSHFVQLCTFWEKERSTPADVQDQPADVQDQPLHTCKINPCRHARSTPAHVQDQPLQTCKIHPADPGSLITVCIVSSSYSNV